MDMNLTAHRGAVERFRPEQCGSSRCQITRLPAYQARRIKKTPYDTFLVWPLVATNVPGIWFA